MEALFDFLFSIAYACRSLVRYKNTVLLMMLEKSYEVETVTYFSSLVTIITTVLVCRLKEQQKHT